MSYIVSDIQMSFKRRHRHLEGVFMLFLFCFRCFKSCRQHRFYMVHVEVLVASGAKSVSGIE